MRPDLTTGLKRKEEGIFSKQASFQLLPALEVWGAQAWSRRWEGQECRVHLGKAASHFTSQVLLSLASSESAGPLRKPHRRRQERLQNRQLQTDGTVGENAQHERDKHTLHTRARHTAFQTELTMTKRLRKRGPTEWACFTTHNVVCTLRPAPFRHGTCPIGTVAHEQMTIDPRTCPEQSWGSSR